MPFTVRRAVSTVAKVAILITAVLGAIAGCVFYLDWSAERKAQSFCADISVGSDISVAVEKAKDKKILYGTYKGYTFYFPGTMFNKAICAASVDQTGKVLSKFSEMEYD